MPIFRFQDRGRGSNPRFPDELNVCDFADAPVCCIGERRPTEVSQPKVHCFSEVGSTRKKPIKLTEGTRNALLKGLHQSGVHGPYGELSDNGIVALAHARHEATKLRDASGSGSRSFNSLAPANTSTRLPPAPPTTLAERQKKLMADSKQARQLDRAQAQVPPR